MISFVIKMNYSTVIGRAGNTVAESRAYLRGLDRLCWAFSSKNKAGEKEGKEKLHVTSFCPLLYGKMDAQRWQSRSEQCLVSRTT